MKVLIADDSPEVLTRLVTMVREIPGIGSVETARDGWEALAAFARLKPDAVVLDFHMPKRNGLEVLQFVKTTRPSTRVLILTNYAFPAYRESCRTAGANFFFDKSKEFEQVGETLTRLAKESYEQS